MTTRDLEPSVHGRRGKEVWDWWRVAWEGRLVLAVVLAGVMGVAFVGTLFMKERYRATALLEINLAPATVLGTARERGRLTNVYAQDRAFKTEFVKIRTRGLLARAIEENGLLEAVPSLATASDPVAALRRALSVERVPQSNVARVMVTWPSAEGAAALANAVAETYVLSDLERSRERVLGRVDRLASSVRKTGAERRDMLEYDRAVLREVLDDEPGERNLDRVFGLASVEDDETLTRLRDSYLEIEREIEAKSALGFGPKHQEILSLEADRDALQVQIAKALGAHLQRIGEELETLGDEQFESSTPGGYVGETLREVREENYEKVLDAMAEQQVLYGLQEGKAHVIDRALPPERPSSPRMGLNLLLAFVVGTGLGVGILVFREYMDVNVKTLEDVETDLGLSLLSVVPRQEDQQLDAIGREAFQTLRTSLVFAAAGRDSRALLVTAAAPQEGKTSTAVHLARALAAAGDSVLLVDCDLRRPQTARMLGANARQGLSRWLADSDGTGWRELIQRVDADLSFLAAGPVPPNPLHLLGLPRFQEGLEEMKSEYRWVVMDSPPASSVSDASVLAAHSDMVLMVIRHDATDREVIRRAVGRLQAVGGEVVGAVLNGVDMSKSYNRDHYYGRYYYGHYYGPDEKARAT